MPQPRRACGGSVARATRSLRHPRASRDLGEGRAQAARRVDAAAGRPAARGAANPAIRRLHGGEHRCRRRRRPELGRSAAAPAQPQGVRERRARSARARDRRGDLAAAGRQERRLRQHRRRAASIAVVHRAVRHGRAHDRGSSARRRGLRAREPDVQEPDPRRRVRLDDRRRAAAPHRRPAARHARRIRRESFLPGRRRVPNHDLRHGRRAVGLQPRVREHADRHGRRRESVRDRDRRRRRSESHRSGPGSGGGGDQLAVKEHPLRGKGRPTEGRRRIPAPHARRVRRPSASAAARLRPRHRPGSRHARRLVRSRRAVQCRPA